MFGSGMMTTANNLIGGQLGRGDASEAWDYFKQITYMSSIMFVALTMLIGLFFSKILNFLTNIEEVG